MKMGMEQLNKNTDNKLGVGIITGVLAFALSSATIQYLDLDPWMVFSYFRIFSTVLFVMVMLAVVFKNMKTTLIFAGVLTSIVLIVALFWMKNGIPEDIRVSVINYFTWLWEFITKWDSVEKISWNHLYVTTIGISTLVSVSLYFLLVKRFLYLPVFLLSIGLFTTQWAIIREVNKFAFYLTLISLVLLYLIRILVDKTKATANRGEHHRFLSLSRFITTALPLVLVLLLIVVIIPKSSEPIKWKWLDDRIKYRNLGGDKYIDFQVYNHFSLAKTGFSAVPGNIGGSVELDFSHILDVYSSEVTYLRGESWPYFDGKSWQYVSKNNESAETILKYSEYNSEKRMLFEPAYGWKFMGLNKWLNKNMRDFKGSITLPGTAFDSILGDHLLPPWFVRKKLDIVYAGVETKTLFAPMYSSLTAFTGLDDVMAETDDTLETKEAINIFTFIHYDYLSMDKENENLILTLRKSKHGIYKETYEKLAYIIKNEDEFTNINISNSMFLAIMDLVELENRADGYYRRYTQVHESLPPRVKTLAKEITKQFDNDYDRVKAIEEYFYKDFSYNLNAETAPEERDFVDWFLFDSKEGYCTYYATAMVTLVRSIGLPARYIEGFLTPKSPEENSRYPVLNSNAHAWAEVYFEGVGWVRFEATPPFAGVVEAMVNNTPNPEFDFEDELDENMDNLDKEDQANIFANVEGRREKGSISTLWAAVFITLAALILLSALVQLYRKILFANVNGKKRFKFAYFELLRILKFRGARIEKGMTLYEFADRVDTAYYAHSVSMKNLTDTYYRIVYSDISIGEEEYKTMGVFYKNFRKELNSELKLWEWLIFRILIPYI